MAAGLARRLRTGIEKESIRYYAYKARLSPQTIVNILNGNTWPDLLTIARLEYALETRLWGYEHRKNPIVLPGRVYIPAGFEPPLEETPPN
ncbi:MAG: hypothetical protein OXR67_08225 [Chloroflexota bacterium]|nr:hypothetical protein [Chloroflexota bacterium]